MAVKPPLTDEQRNAVDEFRKRHRTALLALLFTDVEGSTALKNQMGEMPASALLEHHGKILREILSDFADAQEISTAGDSFFLIFAKPSDAVRFALLAQLRLREMAQQESPDFRVRIGIHLGEVVVAEDSEGGSVTDVLGMQVDLASRVTALAVGGQILMTRGVFDNARQILKGQALQGIEQLSWFNHGLYLLKGSEEPLEICEVGETTAAGLRRPVDCEAGRRAIVATAEPVPGWRPAVEQAVPNTQWNLERRLGEGGFGEVWLARHSRTKELRVFKFCFRSDQLRNLKRELTIFRILKEVLGTREDIARLIDVQFEEAPFYLEFEYTPGGSLREWIASREGFENVPMDLRLEIVAQTATALAAAHSVGVIHKDVKPSNILVEERRDGSVQVRLTDFGIGQITERAALERAGVTQTGFTETVGSSSDPSSYTGTRLYMAPELIAGRPLTVQSDVFSLGVLLYQLVVGDLTQPMTTDWARRVEDPLLREDLRGCLAGEPTDRLSNADELARRLRTLDKRREERSKQEAFERAQARRRGLARAAIAAAALLVVVAFALGYGLYRAETARRQLLVEQEKTKRENYYSTIRFAAMSIAESRFDQAREQLANCPPQFRGWEWGRLQYMCNRGWIDLGAHEDTVEDLAFSPDGRLLASAGKDRIVRVWDLEKRQEIHTLTGHSQSVEDVAFSPDGRFLATASRDRTARVWDVASGRVIQRLEGFSNHVHSVAFAPDGRIAAGSCDFWMRLWNPETGEELNAIEIPEWEVMGIEFMPDSTQYITRGGKPLRDPRLFEVWLVDAQTGELIRSFAGHTDLIAGIALSPDGRLLATCSFDETAKIWDLESGRVFHTIRGHSNRVVDVAFSSDGRLLATASMDRTARLWDVSTGRLVRVFRGYSDSVRSVALSPDGRFVATGGSGSDPTVRLWPIEPTEFLLASFPGQEAAEDTATSSSEVDLAGETEAAASEIWEWQAEGHVRVFRDYRGEGPGIALVAGGILAMVTPEGSVALADTDIGRKIATLRTEELVRSTDASPDGGLLAGGCVGGTIVLWDLKTGRAIRALEHGAGVVHQVAFSPDGGRIASAAAYGDQEPAGVSTAARIWEVRTGKLLAALKGHTAPVHRLAFSPDGTQIATAGRDKTLRLWDAGTGGLLHTFREEDEPQSIAFSPDGLRLLSSTNRNLYIRDKQTGEILATLQPANSICFGPNGQRMVTGGNDSTVNIRDVENWREVLSLPGHENSVSAVVFSPGGLELATADSEGRVIVRPAFPSRIEAYPGSDTMDPEERIAGYRDERMNRRLSAIAVDAPIAGAQRSLDRSEWTPGLSVNVSLHLKWNARASSVSICEVVPAGWEIQNVSHGGRRTGQTITWTVAPWTSPGVVLRYSALPPATKDISPAVFTNALARSDRNQWFRIGDTTVPRAGTLVFQDGAHPTLFYQGAQDAHIVAFFEGERNTGSSQKLEEGEYSAQQEVDHKKILVKFDLSTVPSTFSLARAELGLFAFHERLSGLRTTHTLYVARVLKPWNEGESTQGLSDHDGDRAQPGAVTFLSARHGEQDWETTGALGLTDVADAESSTVAGVDWPGWVTFDVSESVRMFLRDPSSNHGWKISQDPVRGVDDKTIQYVNGIFGYKSSEAPEVHLRPMLILTASEQTGR